MTTTADWLGEARVVAILRRLPLAETLELCERAWASERVVVEIPLQDAESEAVLREVVGAAQARGKIVGAGTITTAERARRAAELGVAFTVAPGVHPDVLRASADLGLPHVPGVASATDIQHALDWGFDVLKAFPAASLGPDWIRLLSAPFPQVRFIATGGVEASNAGSFFAAGAVAVGVGSAIAREGEVERILSSW
jgi:2-dehydro-3-deoxyphosphogluconate aldolase/(4S)-4-hydroxy-2-oxoglutarate aldolase